jgi:hypothetical protein
VFLDVVSLAHDTRGKNTPASPATLPKVLKSPPGVGQQFCVVAFGRQFNVHAARAFTCRLNPFDEVSDFPCEPIPAGILANQQILQDFACQVTEHAARSRRVLFLLSFT